MPKNIVFISISLLISADALAQADTTWLDAKWKPVSREEAAYFRPRPSKVAEGYLITDHFVNGRVQMKGISSTTETSAWVGWVTWYSENGNITQRALFNNDHRVDTLITYHDNGATASIRPFINGQYHGTMLSYDSLGSLTAETNFAGNVLHGTSKDFRDGVLISSENFYQNERDGEQLSYFEKLPNGPSVTAVHPILKTRSVYEKGRKLLEESYHENGNLAEQIHHDGYRRHGPAIGYFPGGSPRYKAFYRNDNLHGPCEIFDSVAIRARCDNGYLDGTYERYDDGRLSIQAVFQNGALRKWDSYHANGNIFRSCTMNMDSLTEYWTTFSPNGAKIMETAYRFHEPYGIWTRYDENHKTAAVNFGFEPVDEAIADRRRMLSEEDDDENEDHVPVEALLRQEPMDDIGRLTDGFPAYYLTAESALRHRGNLFDQLDNVTVILYYGRGTIRFSRELGWTESDLAVEFTDTPPGQQHPPATSFAVNHTSNANGFDLILQHERYEPRHNEVMMFAEPPSELLQRVLRFSAHESVRQQIRENPSLLEGLAAKFFQDNNYGFPMADIALALCREIFDHAQDEY